jgi:hypothetical protein
VKYDEYRFKKVHITTDGKDIAYPTPLGTRQKIAELQRFLDNFLDGMAKEDLTDYEFWQNAGGDFHVAALLVDELAETTYGDGIREKGGKKKVK